jgi:hypothetical protein
MTTNFTVTDTTDSASPKRRKQMRESNWVEGRIGPYTYEANVYACGSQYGIREGNVSKLFIRDETTRKDIVAYDRGWIILPKNELLQEMVDALVEHYWA